MQIKLAAFTFLFSGILLAQTHIVTTQSGNLSIEWEKSLEELMVSKEKEVCTDNTIIEPKREFCRGARIQVFYSKNRSDAEQKLKEVKSLFPGEFANLEYISPDYKVKIGYFESRETAQPILNKAKRNFPSSLVVEETVRCNLID